MIRFSQRFCSLHSRPIALTGGLRWKATTSTANASSSTQGDGTVKPFSAVPSPSGSVPIIKHQRLLKGITSMSEFTVEHFKELGPIFKLDFMGQSVVYVADPSAVEKVFRNEGKYPTRDTSEKNINWILKRRNESNFAFQSGEEWRVNRSKLGKQLIPANVYGYCPGFNKVSRRFIRNVYDVQNADGFVEDARDLIRYWSLEVATHFVYGADLDCRNDKEGLAKELQDAVGGLLDCIFDLQTALPLFKVFPTKAYKDFNKNMDKLIEIGQVYADKYSSDIEARAAVSDEKFHGMSLLEQWLIEGKLSIKDAISHSINMLGAGMDTTAHTTAFVLYSLSKHPEVQEKAYKQITSVLGDDEKPDGDSLQKMPYLGHLIKETQRLYPVAPFVPRMLDTDIDLLGYHVPAKTTIVPGLEAMGQDPTLFKDPLKFNPDRWTTDDIHPFILLPFGFGPRACWGRRFAEVEMKVLLYQLIRHFKMESDFPNDKLSSSGLVLKRPTVPIRIKFTPRNQ
ncbi:PREDICTED: cytochrome P450 27C1-like isoform X1 [Amphimedon queenslandica]|uniref:Cytochrome P450 n=1 Tax=Amphimedon queenslandica TaxID=400682 RepID=A0AAN0INH3_AMPQE|nr:PREDICTED: cytochrome P450 27C1-like isoform X1 [Amphimedon queenslandica]|eukprot:XP_011405662.1 PREDICTED: cytochrome P450 27C1-like isoform X1 [Amphimedon queenslandica]